MSGGPYLLFEIHTAAHGHESTSVFGLDVADVSHVMEPSTTVEVPLAPAVVVGVLNHRGRIVTVIDPAPLLGFLPQPRPIEALVALRRTGRRSGQLGLVVRRTYTIVGGEALPEVEVPGGPCVRQVARSGERLVHLLSYDALITAIAASFDGLERGISAERARGSERAGTPSKERSP